MQKQQHANTLYRLRLFFLTALLSPPEEKVNVCAAQALLAILYHHPFGLCNDQYPFSTLYIAATRLYDKTFKEIPLHWHPYTPRPPPVLLSSQNPDWSVAQQTFRILLSPGFHPTGLANHLRKCIISFKKTWHCLILCCMDLMLRCIVFLREM